ncbi:hypothetical protein C2I18_08875 [Paenibacillus sp. PK3_47]|uniref:dual OB domain-containing protein n=1 Tax=Paenibacillus sp. PK3_47 TaxID=2072642 RepID=UPI00201E721B|nr:hypothetical protein [Paenibacillus sp. PK3_47]UQZ33642.1 hypothetical protein C2I18_08875 [Paenibacillus sp. PK3_47]
MEIVILAVTKASSDGSLFCIAGMNYQGQWIRPISKQSSGRFWTRQELTYQSGAFVNVGEIWDVQGHAPKHFQHPNHTEDFELSSHNYVRDMSNAELMAFLEQHCEGQAALSDVFSANRRSTCLVKVDLFDAQITRFEDKKPKPKMTFRARGLNLRNPHTNNGDIVVKDCKWEALVLQRAPYPARYNHIYLCIGLATIFNGIEHPQVIGLHTEPAVSMLSSYPD